MPEKVDGYGQINQPKPAIPLQKEWWVWTFNSNISAKETTGVSPMPAAYIMRFLWFIADTNLNKELSTSRIKFYPATKVRDIMCADPSQNVLQLATATKAKVTEEDNNFFLQEIYDLQKQGNFL